MGLEKDRRLGIARERETHEGYGGGETGGLGVRLSGRVRGESSAVPQPRGTRNAIDVIRPKKQPLKGTRKSLGIC